MFQINVKGPNEMIGNITLYGEQHIYIIQFLIADCQLKRIPWNKVPLQKPSVAELLMETESTLPCPQEPFNGPHLEPYESSTRHPIPSKTNFNVILPPSSRSS
jgi:hypothetical protein